MATNESAVQDITVVDSDVHLTIPPGQIARYVDDRYKRSVEKGYVFPSSVWDFSMGGKIDDERHFAFNGLEAVQAFREEYHVEYPILNTFEPLDKFPTDLSVSLMRGFNDLLLDQYLDEDEDLYGLAGLTLRDPEAAAAEIERLGDEDQIVGAYIGNTSIMLPPGDPVYDVVYRAADDNNMTIAFHANADDFGRDFPMQNRGFETYLEVHSVTHLWYQTMAITSLVTQGVPVKFPDLNFVILEAGISWIPYVMMRLNREYSMRRGEAPLLEQLPEEYIRDSFYFASQPVGEPMDDAHLKKIVEIIGVENLLFASDYPHWDFDNPDEVDRHLRRLFSAEERKQVLYENPSEAFNLSV